MKNQRRPLDENGAIFGFCPQHFLTKRRPKLPVFRADKISDPNPFGRTLRCRDFNTHKAARSDLIHFLHFSTHMPLSFQGNFVPLSPEANRCRLQNQSAEELSIQQSPAIVQTRDHFRHMTLAKNGAMLNGGCRGVLLLRQLNTRKWSWSENRQTARRISYGSDLKPRA